MTGLRENDRLKSKSGNGCDRLISVVLPFRDGETELLQRAIDSVLRQEKAVFEILLTDDGSKEAAGEELDRISETDGRIRVMHLEGAGVSAARNRAIYEADGDIITFLDSDDALAPCCFAEALQILADHPELDGIWGGTCFLHPEEMERILGEETRRSGFQTPAGGQKDLIFLTPERLHKTRAECIGEPYRFSDGYINRGIAARFLRRKALLEKQLFFPEGIRMYEDTIWNLEMMEKLALAYIPRVWYYYLDNVKSVSNTFHQDGLERIEEPLVRIRSMLEFSDPVEYSSYTRFLMDSLRYVCRTLYSHPVWKPEKGEKERLRKHLYTEAPWNEIGSRRFREYAENRDRRKALLYRMRLLLLYWNTAG